MLVGWGGNNGSTLTAGILANKHGLTWHTARGDKSPNYHGSISQSATVRVGLDTEGKEFYVPLKSLLPMVEPNNLVIGGWDINSANLEVAMNRAQVLDYELQTKLGPFMREMKPLPSIYEQDFIASNQKERANNVITGTKQEQIDQLRKDIRDFKFSNKLDKVLCFLA